MVSEELEARALTGAPSEAGFEREGGKPTMKKNSQLGKRIQGDLYRNPNNPFEAWDEDGPCLPITIDDSPSPGIPPPGSLVDIDFETGRSRISSLAEELNWKT